MADATTWRELHEVLDELLWRRAIIRRDPACPIVRVVGESHTVNPIVRKLAMPFQDYVPLAIVSSASDGRLQDLVGRIAGENGQLGVRANRSLLPPLRFPLTDFVLWARQQQETEREVAGSAPETPNDLLSPEALRRFEARLKEWRHERRAGTRRAQWASFDFLIRAVAAWVPLGTLTGVIVEQGFERLSHVVHWLSAVMPFLAWVSVIIFVAAGTLFQTWLSIRGSLFNRWFGKKKQPYLRRRHREKLHAYGLRIAKAKESEFEPLLVNAMLEDLRQAYKRWLLPWPSYGRGRYCLLALESTTPDTAGDRFLEIMVRVTTETGQFAPLVVLAGATDSPVEKFRSSNEVGELSEKGVR